MHPHLQCHFTRRAVLRIITAAGLATRARPIPTRAQTPAPALSYPMGLLGHPLGDGMLVRHGYATENTWFNPGWWHTGEDWYLTEGDTTGMAVYAVAPGEVVYAGFDYPGPVVIVDHGNALYSLYGHLDYTLAVAVGEAVGRGQVLGTVLNRTDGLAPSHLHFEMRAFFTTPEVNGNTPRYSVACGFECPPGPGYWPMDAPEHPSAMGWRNPTHVINRRAWPDGVPEGTEVVVSEAAPGSTPLWTAPSDGDGAELIGDLPLTAADRYPLLAVDAGDEVATGTSAEGYRLWYRIALANGEFAWVQAAVPSANDTGSDGRPSSVRFDFLPAVTAN